MDHENIGIALSFLTNLSAFVAVLVILLKVKYENKKLNSESRNADADANKSTAETFALLSGQLKQAYVEIDALRENQELILYHRDYETYLLRCIRLTTARLVSIEIDPPCTVNSFTDFMKERMKNDFK